MTEEINEDNCVLKDFELHAIFSAFHDVYEKHPQFEPSFNTISQKIQKLNDLAKQTKDKINHNDYIRDDTSPF